MMIAVARIERRRGSRHRRRCLMMSDRWNQSAARFAAVAVIVAAAVAVVGVECGGKWRWRDALLLFDRGQQQHQFVGARSGSSDNVRRLFLHFDRTVVVRGGRAVIVDRVGVIVVETDAGRHTRVGAHVGGRAGGITGANRIGVGRYVRIGVGR